MGEKFKLWEPRVDTAPKDYGALQKILLENRSFEPLTELQYGDHGLEQAIEVLQQAIRENKRIALYADYDVDGTMSCVSWIWFFRAIGFENFVHYIPCRFKEGYGVNLAAVKYLIDDCGAQVIITMDTGITANEEAAYCRSRGIEFVCTDHHKIQPNKMPDCIILNPKQHPDSKYQELCGCGITFVLLRRLAQEYSLTAETWTDLLALVGMATICDVVPLNSVNHRLARLGVQALLRSKRPILCQLKQAAALSSKMDEKDVGFRLGPRINAVGRLGHADKVIEAFVGENPESLIEYMNSCNEKRKGIQEKIVREAMEQAESQLSEPILFMGGDWHPGVVGIAASKIAERFWRPTWLFQREEGRAKGSARSIVGFDVTEAMQSAATYFDKFGGHQAAGGFSFDVKNETPIREKLCEYARKHQEQFPNVWMSRIVYDCELPLHLVQMPLVDVLDTLKPFGNGFEEPRFVVQASIVDFRFYRDKKTGAPRHTAVEFKSDRGRAQKVVFFNEVLENLAQTREARFVISASRSLFRGQMQLSLQGHDFESLRSP